MSIRQVKTAIKLGQREGVGSLAKKAFAYIWKDSLVTPLLRSILGDRFAEKIILFTTCGYWPQIHNPRSFNEKIIHRKLFSNEDLYSTVADKWVVRDYVKSKVGDGVLNEVYHVTDDAKTISFEELPDEFVIKATHASGFNRIVDDSDKEDVEEIKAECERWLSRTYGEAKCEYWYSDIKPRILIERRLHGKTDSIPQDYKFFVFHGEVRLIEVDVNRFSGHRRRMYSRDWEPQQFTYAHPLAPATDPPDNLEEMISIAEKIAGDFEFARVDLYEPSSDQVIFGEITLAPESGHGRFDPVEKDFEIGRYW